jgi:DNA anti-recombination protein RmuC
MSYSGDERRNKPDTAQTIELLVGKMSGIISVVNSLKNETQQTIIAEVSKIQNDLTTLRSEMESLNQKLTFDVETLATGIEHLEEKGMSAADSIRTDNEKEHNQFYKALVSVRRDFHKRISTNENNDFKFINETRENIQKINKRIDDARTDIEDLKRKPAENSAKKWDTLRDKILWGAIGFILSAAGLAIWNILQELLKRV